MSPIYHLSVIPRTVSSPFLSFEVFLSLRNPFCVLLLVNPRMSRLGSVQNTSPSPHPNRHSWTLWCPRSGSCLGIHQAHKRIGLRAALPQSNGFAPFGEYWRNLRRISSIHLFSPKRIASCGDFRHGIGLKMVEEIRVLVKIKGEVEEPESFKPQRFMREDVAILGSDLRLAPFGSGRRVCPGKAMGLATVELWLAQLLQSFQWVPGEAVVDLSERLKLSMEMKKPWVCKAVPRVFPV
ncbi:hypothetical protein SLE2022_291890 [Rubroshorea leprosula]